jgi:hypothetical protein
MKLYHVLLAGYVLSYSHTKKPPQKVYEKINKNISG